MTPILGIRFAMFAVGVLAALPANARTTSYAEILFKDKFEAHIQEMVADGINRKSANYIAYAALARASYELCGDHLFPKSMAQGSYHQSLAETSLPKAVVDRHMRAFEHIVQAEFQDQRALMQYCGSKP